MTKCTHKQLMTACMLAGTLMLGACTSTPPVTKEVSIVPITNHLEETNGAFVLKSNTSIRTNSRSRVFGRYAFQCHRLRP